MIKPVRLYRSPGSKGADRAVVVSTAPSTGKPGEHLVVVARGPRGKLGAGTSYGLFGASELEARLAEVVASLEAEGFKRSGVELDLDGLNGKAAVVARTALSLGWKQNPAAVGPLAQALADHPGVTCSILDALGALGPAAAAEAIPIVRPYAERKLLSRRRSAVEALRALGDTEGLAAAASRAMEERLSPAVNAALADPASTQDPSKAVTKLVEALRAMPARDRGQVVDALYEIATPPAVAASVASLLENPVGKAHVFRYAKSVFKRSMLRFDLVTFGALAHKLDAEARGSKGTTATVKSGFDGKQRQMPIFHRATQLFLRRLSWRWMRRVAHHRPALYAHAAAEVLASYGPSDLGDAHRLETDLAGCYLVSRILFGKSARLVFDARTLRTRLRSAKTSATPKPGAREESYPELWDAEPSAFMRVLAASQLVDAHRFALEGVERHPQVVRAADAATIVALLLAPHGPTVELAVAELGRRFDPNKPDLALLARLLDDPRETVASLAHRWLRLSASVWTRSIDRVLAFLTSTNGTSRSFAADVVLAALPSLSAEDRKALAQRLVAKLLEPEATEGAHDAIGRVASEGLTEELGPLFSVKDLTSLLVTGSLSARAVAGTLLGKHPGALTELGVTGVMVYAEDDVAAVRAASHALLRAAAADLQIEAGLLLQLAESRWPDTRRVAFELLSQLAGLDELGLEGILGLCDATYPDAQAMGRELVTRRFADFDPEVVLFRLAEHPHPSMRRFTLELIERHLRPGFVALARLEGFFRAALLDLMPDRTLKRRILALLADRGSVDEAQGELVVKLLDDVVRTKTVADFERIAEALVRVQLAHPDMKSVLRLRLEDVAS